MLLLPDGRLGPADDLEQQRSDLDRRAPAAAIPADELGRRRAGPVVGRGREMKRASSSSAPDKPLFLTLVASKDTE